MKKLLVLLSGTLLLLIPALINAYPMIYSDTSTYLASGFVLQPPMDRPITYGLFIRLFSLNGFSLWPVIFMQSFLLSWLIYLLASLILGENQKFKNYIFLALVAFASFSGAGWASCYLIPDIFTPIMILSAILILFSRADRGKRTLYYFVYGFSVAMHSSHIPIGLGLLSLLLVARLLLWNNNWLLFKLRPVLILIVITLTAILAMGSSLSKSKHVFLMGAFIEQGIIQPYLDQSCNTYDYKLCEYKDSLPEHAWQFIWEESSPLYKLGGWKETKEEFKAIIRGTFSSPEFILLHIKASLKATLQQLARFEALDFKGVAPNASELQYRVEKYVPNDLNRFENSRQNLGLLAPIKWWNRAQLILVLFSLFALILIFSFSRTARTKPLLVQIGILIFLGIMLNAWVCGTFSTPIDRTGNRMIWLIPAYAILLLPWEKWFPIKKTT
ncbi:MAG: hypothetical protein QNK35_00960 [Bacteroides sp.]|nr:hypothetical protein [Bacteroides sp.]